MRTLAGVVIAAAAVASPRVAAADKVAVKVVEVAGGVAYVAPGADAGIVAGTVIHIGKRDYTVVDATHAHALLRPDGDRLDVGDKGSAQTTPGATATARTLPAPRPLDAFVGQWPDAVRPASTQSPAPVPLGAASSPGRLRAMGWAQLLLGSNGRALDGALEVGTRVSYELLDDRPLAADLDVAARLHRGGIAGARVPVFVRTAQLRWGDPDDPRVALGRLRWASATTGMLDGVRISGRLGDAELAAFGGLVPDPVDGAPEPSAGRFGLEATYEVDGAWAPRVAIGAQGSTWQGQLDERRLSIDADLHHGGLAVDAFAEVSAFASDNPWGARGVELTGAGGSVAWRGRRAHFGIDASLLRPERSLRLDAALPVDWACVRELPDEACAGDDLWAQGTASAGVSGRRWSLDLGGSGGTTHGGEVRRDASGFLLGALRVLPRRGRIEAGLAGGRASFLDWVSADLGVAMPLQRRLDARLRVREEQRLYTGALDPELVHLILADVRWSASRELDLGVAASAALGDGDAFTLLSTVVWRPRP